jgi:hypothetical protein
MPPIGPDWFRLATPELALAKLPEGVVPGKNCAKLSASGVTVVDLFGDAAKLNDPRTPITCRIHDECNGSDVFGSDICTCRPYLIHGIEECARGAQAGGLGVIIYNRKEGRALGEVTKFLVNAFPSPTSSFLLTPCRDRCQESRRLL